MRTLHLLVASALLATNSGAQTPLTVDTNFRFYYTPELLDQWESTLASGTQWIGVMDVVLRHDGNIMVSGSQLKLVHEFPWGEPLSVVMDPLNGGVQEFIQYCGGRLIEIPTTDQYFFFNGRLNYDCSPDFSFDLPHLFNSASSGHHIVLPDRSVLRTGEFRITEEDPLRYVLLKLDQWGALDPSFASRSATGGNLWGGALHPLANGQYLFNGSWDTYEERPCGPVIRIDPDGEQDISFAFEALIANVHAIHEQPDGKVILAGQFMLQEYFPDTLNLLRVNPDGSLDHTFYNLNHVTLRTATDPVLSTARFAGINVLEPLDAGRFVIGGNFTHIDEERRGCIACVDTAGHLLDCWANGGLVPGHHTPSGGPSFSLDGFERLANGETYFYGKYQGFIDSRGLHPEQCMISKMYMPDVGVDSVFPKRDMLKVWPNPSNHVLNVRSPDPQASGLLVIRDPLGREVMRTPMAGQNMTLDVHGLAQGTYTLEWLDASSARSIIKWIKQ